MRILFSFVLAAVVSAASVASAQISFQSNWDTGCTGGAESCLIDGGAWDADSGWPNPNLSVERGGSGGVPNAMTGNHVLRVGTYGQHGDWLIKNNMQDLTKHNQYFRWYKYINCDYNGASGQTMVNHGFQDPPTSENFYCRDTIQNCPGPNCRIARALSMDGVNPSNGNLGSGNYAGVNWGINHSPSVGAHMTQCGQWVREEMWIECPGNNGCLNTGTGQDVAVRIHQKETVVTGPQAGTVYDDDDFMISNYNGNDRSPVSFSTFYNSMGGGVAMNGGHRDFSLGVSGQPNVRDGLHILYYLDSFAYGSSNTDGAWIGANCEAEPGAAGCDGSPPPPPPPPAPDPDPLAAPNFLID